MKNNDHELLYHYELKLHIIHKLMVHLKDIFKSIMIQVYYWLQNSLPFMYLVFIFTTFSLKLIPIEFLFIILF